MASNHRFFIFIALILLLTTAVNSAKLYKRVPYKLHHTSYIGPVSPANVSDGTLVARDTCSGCPAGTTSCTATECYKCPPDNSPCSDGNGCCPNGETCVSNTNLCSGGCVGFYTICGDGCCNEGYTCDLTSQLCIETSSYTPPSISIDPPQVQTYTVTTTSTSTSTSTFTSASTSTSTSTLITSSASSSSITPSSTIIPTLPSLSENSSSTTAITTSATDSLFKSAAMNISAPSIVIALITIALAMLNIM